MDVKKSSKLPEGVGKKIVEALKKQNVEAQPQPAVQEDIPESAQDDFGLYMQEEDYDSEGLAEEEDFESADSEESDIETDYTPFADENEDFVSSEEEEPKYVLRRDVQAEEPLRRVEMPKIHTAESIQYSPNVEILIQLISQLPTGVTRQTGAQIIRQTMEAMGISMNRLLSEAQQAQDELSQSIKNNMYTIEEFRNNIRILEKDVQISRKKADELEDLISLFILSEKEGKR